MVSAVLPLAVTRLTKAMQMTLQLSQKITRCLLNRTTLSCVCSARSRAGSRMTAVGPRTPPAAAEAEWSSSAAQQPGLFAASSGVAAWVRFGATGTEGTERKGEDVYCFTTAAVCAFKGLAVPAMMLEDGAAARPTHPGGGPNAKGVAPKFSAISAFFKHSAGYSARLRSS